MSKTLILLVALVSCLSAFTIVQKHSQPALEAINWPFTLCGKGAWNIEKLTLAQQPARNINDDIDVVAPSLCSSAPLLMTPSSPTPTST